MDQVSPDTAFQAVIAARNEKARDSFNIAGGLSCLYAIGLPLSKYLTIAYGAQLAQGQAWVAGGGFACWVASIIFGLIGLAHPRKALAVGGLVAALIGLIGPLMALADVPPKPDLP